MTGDFGTVEDSAWGYHTKPVKPADLIEALAHETKASIDAYQVIPDGPEPGRNEVPSAFRRVSVSIGITPDLCNLLMNGASGYRAQYYLGSDNGSLFNRALVDSIAPLIAEAEHLYRDRFDRDFCERSLRGSFSKIWYSKEISDPSAQTYLETLPEVINAPRWRDHWQSQKPPRKGLLAPLPDETAILLNGTFLNPATGEEFDTKPDRAAELFEKGWT
jgi:hypothetical protein